MRGKPRYNKMEEAQLIRFDNKRVEVVDELLNNLFIVLIKLIDRSFYDAFVKIFINICLAKEFNEFIILIKLMKIFVLLLLKLERQDDAIRVYEFLRDICEDTQNNSISMDVYESLGKLLQESGEYEKAIVCFKKLLQIAWAENDMLMETKAYECLSIQHFYLQ